MAGYSKRTLVQKLGIKENLRTLIVNAPDDYEKTLGKLPQSVAVNYSSSEALAESRSISSRPARTIYYDFVQYFSRSQEDLEEAFPKLRKLISQSGMLWISWPKGSCNYVGTDLNENIVRDIGLKNKMVDIKVIAVDEIWSGLKFVIRIKDRK